MLRPILIFTLLLFACFHLSSQAFVPAPSNSDCEGAIIVKDSLVWAKKAPLGYGQKMEVSASKESSQSIEKEHHSLWYKIPIEYDCTFSFTLSAMNESDDHDFMLFVADQGDDFCRLLSENKTQVARSNIARNDSEIGSSTGLQELSSIEFQQQGMGPTFSKSIPVSKGQIIWLLVDNVYPNGGGHKIHFYKKRKIQINPSQLKLQIDVFDKETKNPIASDIMLIVKDDLKKDTLEFNNVGQIILNVDSLDYIEIIVRSELYLTHIEKTHIYGRNSTKKIEVLLQPFFIGKKILLEEVYFYAGSERFRSESKRTLRQLQLIMKNNPSLKIEIQGHVNQPLNMKRKKKNDFYQELSERRALEVYNYLLKRGISKGQLQYKGFGFAKMIYPYAKQESEMQKNRRVEIQIVDI